MNQSHYDKRIHPSVLTSTNVVFFSVAVVSVSLDAALDKPSRLLWYCDVEAAFYLKKFSWCLYQHHLRGRMWRLGAQHLKGQRVHLSQSLLGLLQLMTVYFCRQLVPCFRVAWHAVVSGCLSVAKSCGMSLTDRMERSWFSSLAGTTSAASMTCSWPSRCSDQVRTG